jgi:hypothetical protein
MQHLKVVKCLAIYALKYVLGNKIKGEEMNGECSMDGRDEKCIGYSSREAVVEETACDSHVHMGWY